MLQFLRDLFLLGGTSLLFAWGYSVVLTPLIHRDVGTVLDPALPLVWLILGVATLWVILWGDSE